MTNNLDPASAYFGRDLEAMSFAKNYHRWVVETFRPSSGKRLIEVGAGSGNFTEFLLDTLAPSEVVALEPSENMFPCSRNDGRRTRRCSHFAAASPTGCSMRAKRRTRSAT